MRTNPALQIADKLLQKQRITARIRRYHVDLVAQSDASSDSYNSISISQLLNLFSRIAKDNRSVTYTKMPSKSGIPCLHKYAKRMNFKAAMQFQATDAPIMSGMINSPAGSAVRPHGVRMSAGFRPAPRDGLPVSIRYGRPNAPFVRAVTSRR